MVYFEDKHWLSSLEQRLYMAKTWPSFCSKINELRAGYFFENILGFQLAQHEIPTVNSKNVDFKGTKNNAEFFIEVKTPLDLERKNWRINRWDGYNETVVYNLLDKCIEQLPRIGNNVVVLSDDLNLPLFYDGSIIDSIKIFLNSPNYKKIRGVCILGGIFLEDMYKWEFVVNPNATNPIEESMFRRVKNKAGILRFYSG